MCFVYAICVSIISNISIINSDDAVTNTGFVLVIVLVSLEALPAQGVREVVGHAQELPEVDLPRGRRMALKMLVKYVLLCMCVKL